MDKKVVIAGAGFCALAAALAAVKKSTRTDPKPEIWDKMRAKMEEMPEDFPPRMMYDNIETTKANTDKILELLKQGEG